MAPALLERGLVGGGGDTVHSNTVGKGGGKLGGEAPNPAARA